MIDATTHDTRSRVVPIDCVLPSLDDEALALAVLHWPEGEGERRRLRGLGAPRLLLVRPDAPPPVTWDADEDWIRLPASLDDVQLRARMVCRRAGAAVRDLTAMAQGRR